MKFYIPLLLVSLALLSSLLFMIFLLPSRRHRRRRRRADDRFINGVPTSTERYESMYSISLARFEDGGNDDDDDVRNVVSMLNLRLRFVPQRNGIYDARNLSATHKKTRS